jgi:hypothetical protein
MKTILMAGSMVVTIALVFYTIGFLKIRIKRFVTSRVLLFYTIGITLDITATTLMIIGSGKGLMTLHGIIGYSSLAGMLADTLLLWRHNLKEGPDRSVNPRLHLYSRISYAWWVVAYITGGLLVFLSNVNGQSLRPL